MNDQPEALRLAEELCEPMPGFPEPTSLEKAAGNELRRLHQHELASRDWLDKTDWVQETAQAGELGMHRADVLKKRIDALTESNTKLLAALKDLIVDNSSLSMTQHLALYREARAAIAKAEGRDTRCRLCRYQHGHAIGCSNNPVDIALSRAGTQP